MTPSNEAAKLVGTTGTSAEVLSDPDVAHLVIHHNKVIGAHLVPGLHVDTEEIEDGIDCKIVLDEKTKIAKPVHLCFGMLPKTGVQRIIMNVEIKEAAEVAIKADCTFPNAVDVKHIMEAKIHVGKGAQYSYFERHVHSDSGGVTVLPKAVVELDEDARFKADFELVKGRVGTIRIDYETTCKARSVLEMTAKVNGKGDDLIELNETGHLVGEGARGVLTSRIAVRGNARAEVNNKITATAPFARGHVDCKEIIQDHGVAKAIPIVEVHDPRAHVTHEAAIGSVGSKELETLMAHGLTEDEAVELIIQGLLS